MFFTILAMIGNVLFTILKILLFLFVFVAIVIGLVLFVPVRYRASVKYYEEKVNVTGSLFWLMHAVSLKVESDGKTGSYILKIFGIKILPLKDDKRKEKKSRKNGKKKTADKEQHTMHENSEDKKEDDSIGSDIKKENYKKSLPQKAEIKEKKSGTKRRNSKILSIIKKIPELFKKIAGRLKKIKETIKKIWSAVKEGSEKVKLVKDFALCDESRNMVCFVHNNVLHLWKHIRPKYLYTDIIFGLDDPALTGKVLGALAAFCAMAGFKPGLTPDFEKKIFEGEIEIKGRIMFFVLLKIAIRVVFSEEIKSFRKEYDNLREVL